MIATYIETNQQELIRFALILIGGLVIIKVILKLLEKSSVIKKIDITVGKFLAGLVKLILYMAYVIILLSVLGVPMTTFVAMLSAIGLAIALALQGNLANFSSALVILFFKPFKVGDFIESGTNLGTVQEIQMLFTYVLTPDNRKIIIPNSDLVNTRVINYTSETTRRLDMVFTASYEDDMDQVIELLTQIVGANEKILPEPAPVIRLFNHGQSALEYDVKVWIQKEDFWQVKYGLNEAVRRSFLENDIKIPYPQRELWLNQDNFSGMNQ